MNQQHQRALVASLLTLALGLAGCSSLRGESSGSSGTSGMSGSSGASGTTDSKSDKSGKYDSGNSGSSGDAGERSIEQNSATPVSTPPTNELSSMADPVNSDSIADASSSAQQGSSSTGVIAAAGVPNSTVVAIEQVPRPHGGIAGTDTGAIGSTSSGATDSSMAAERVYRITLRMDDGSTQIVTQNTMPEFRSGDRVNHTGGVIKR